MVSENPDQINKKETPTPDDRILIWCHYCGQKYRLRPELSGKTGTCDECNNDFLIPSISQIKTELKKSISFRCEHCNKKLLKPEKLAGIEITCHGCDKKVTVPENIDEEHSPIDLLEPYLVAETTRTDLKISVPTQDTESLEEKILFWCNCCGQKYRLPRRLDGKSGICAKCKNFLFIPHVSQSKPELKKTISFPCKHCGKKQLKARELAGTETTCYHCSKKYVIPAKSKKSLIQIVNPISLLEPFLVAETTRTDIPVPDDKILFWCSHCGQKYRLPRNLNGKAGICTKCQNYLFIPHVSQTRPKLEWSVVFPCKYCGQKLRKARKLAGTEAKCKHCSRKVIIPEKSKISVLPEKGSSLEERILFWCSYCAQKYRLPKHLAGKTGTCDNCQKHFVIPKVSQIKPDLKNTIIFPCVDCDKTLWEAEDLIGVEVQCSRCGEGNIVPEKSEKSLIQKLDYEKDFGTPVVPKAMAGDPIKPMFSSDSQTVRKASSNKSSNASVITPELKPAPPHKKQLVITDKPPIIHRMKNYFHEKAEKYFIFAMIVIVLDHISDKIEAKHHPSKAFVTFCTFTITGIILLGTWNFVMSAPSEKTINSRYNITCRKCGHNEIRRFKNVAKQTCSKCHNHVSFTYKCDKCDKSFAYNETKRKTENASNNPDIIKCPFCHSEDNHYLIPKKTSPKKR
jgi:DNA-directed RNA polymerase subunit RPC12/RpoP